MRRSKLHIDIETYSSVDIKTSGAYKYAESEDFEILIVAYAVDDEPVQVYDFKDLPLEFFDMLESDDYMKYAHNAAFERVCFRRVGYDVPLKYWRCSAVKASYCGLPMGLDALSKALNLGEKAKSATGKALIRYFSCPVKPTKVNGGRTRNYPHHNPEKWQEYKDYCALDVEAEREACHRLAAYTVPLSEWRAYQLDQRINDRGVRIDKSFAANAIAFDDRNRTEIDARLKELTCLDNPNSPVQLRQWVESKLQKPIPSLAKEALATLLEGTSDEVVREVLTLRQKAGKTSIKKYAAMLACAGEGDRARGLFQFYGAGRTGRWAGRLIQLQNLPKNFIGSLELARELVAEGDYDTFAMLYDVSDTLSQLIRTALIPEDGRVFAVADFSAIEARVIAWLAGEEWRMEVFRSHGKIYEASASRMFNVPIESIGKGSDLRSKGKVAELALGYQGSVGALAKMGGESMGLSRIDMETIVAKWRAANPNIVKMWGDFNKCAINAVCNNATVKHTNTGIIFKGSPEALRIELPSGRELIYWNAVIYSNTYGNASVRYKGVNQDTKQWGWVDTYGGKIAENIVQAVARDLLLDSMVRVEDFADITLHVHDEIACEVFGETDLIEIEGIMGEVPAWAKGLPLGADGYLCNFYKKD